MCKVVFGKAGRVREGIGEAVSFSAGVCPRDIPLDEYREEGDRLRVSAGDDCNYMYLQANGTFYAPADVEADSAGKASFKTPARFARQHPDHPLAFCSHLIFA